MQGFDRVRTSSSQHSPKHQEKQNRSEPISYMFVVVPPFYPEPIVVCSQHGLMKTFPFWPSRQPLIKLQTRGVRNVSALGLHSTIAVGHSKKFFPQKNTTPKSRKKIVHVGLEGLANQILALETPPYIQEKQQELVTALINLSQKRCPSKIVQKRALYCAGNSHEHMWELSVDQHADLHERAERELESLRTLLGPQHWREMLEEVMRDKLRSQYPIISAQSIWNAVQQ